MPFKIKIGVLGTAFVVLLTVALMVLAVNPLSDRAEQEVIGAVRRAAVLAPQRHRLYAFDLLARAELYASQKDFAAGIKEAAGRARRIAIYDAINEIDKRLAAENRKPGFLGVVDKTGLIIARDLDPNADHGDKLGYPVVDAVLASGRASTSIWMMKDRMMHAAVAPIVADGAVHGAVAIAYDFTAADARTEAAYFGANVAYFMQSGIRASSFVLPGDPNTEDAGMVAAVHKATQPRVAEILAADKASEIIDLEIGGELHKAIVGPLPMAVSAMGDLEKKLPAYAKDGKAGFIALASVDRELAPVRRARYLVLGFGVLFLLVVAGVMWFVAQHFVRAQDRLELGVNEMISGNLEHTFEVLEEFEGLANALNVLMARLLGRPEPGEDEEGEAWRADVIFVEEPGAGGESELASQLAAEPEDGYYARIFEEYVEARRRLHLPVEGITLDGLTRKLRANEAMLKAKHKCQMVRFAVRTAAGKVSFQPVRIG